MAVIDSRSAKVLAPIGSENTGSPDDKLRVWLSALTGLDKEHVRRRWLTRPGTRFAVDENWAAVGVISVATVGTPYQSGHKGNIDDPVLGDIKRISHQTLTCVASFYGSNAQELADTFREGAQIFQNAQALKRVGLVLQGINEDVQHLPDFLFEQWVDRYDVTFKVGRAVVRIYGVRDLASVGDIEIHTEKGTL